MLEDLEEKEENGNAKPEAGLWHIRDLYDQAPRLFLSVHNMYRINHDIPILELDEEVKFVNK